MRRAKPVASVSQELLAKKLTYDWQKHQPRTNEILMRIIGGKVYDPANGIDGVVKEICIADGRIVAEADGGRTIDATGMIVFPGGVDVHTHVAGGAINFARAMTPEDHRRTQAFIRTKPAAAAWAAWPPRRSPPAISTPAWAGRR